MYRRGFKLWHIPNKNIRHPPRSQQSTKLQNSPNFTKSDLPPLYRHFRPQAEFSPTRERSRESIYILPVDYTRRDSPHVRRTQAPRRLYKSRNQPARGHRTLAISHYIYRAKIEPVSRSLSLSLSFSLSIFLSQIDLPQRRKRVRAGVHARTADCSQDEVAGSIIGAYYDVSNGPTYVCTCVYTFSLRRARLCLWAKVALFINLLLTLGCAISCRANRFLGKKMA